MISHMDTQENAILCRLCVPFVHIIRSEFRTQTIAHCLIRRWYTDFQCKYMVVYNFFFKFNFFMYFFLVLAQMVLAFLLRNLICMSPLNQTKGTHIFDANRCLPVCVSAFRCEW